MTWLSVIIPTYNGQDYLKACLESILIQDETDVEYLVVDDGSTDDTLSILKAYQKKIPLNILKKERTGNWVTNTNYALGLANSEYVCFLHQDDLWLQGRLSTIKKLISQMPGANFLLHPSRFIDIHGRDLGGWRCPLPIYPEIIHSNYMIRRLLVQNFIPIPSPVFRRELALKVGGLDEQLWYTADWDFWLKLSFYGGIVYHPNFLSAFRVHPNSQTVTRSSYIEDFRQQLEIVVNKHIELWDFDILSKRKVRKVCNFSVEVNTSLAKIIHGQSSDLYRLVRMFFSLSPEEWYVYFRDSRITERVISRLRGKLSSVP